ncbi:MAG: glutamate-5-semialdehyde dehydrogenase [Kordiimonadaceae bacterium]|jgi:glutamate-5-semialdehyde dehydrogenase|nr:glutamate-5-semialdehyde dehydrogenase [Kordiimonadaceae bacterium]MBT6035943.1 glutamate-5-semialdehyde dehydrogenase [Kordiimonadaceae bacterium]MBT6329011.1 glutamate-5-semialdehyde dehydrogenase [Kordiimonadaceae bacterium]MBT7583100.1 glutamate-5-semialdehyde dehydrogenase [Kordiimonadaceae bacterium]
MNSENDIKNLMQDIGRQAKAASEILALCSSSDKNTALSAAAKEIRLAKDDIITANNKDMDIAKGRGLTGAMLDRLLLDDERIDAIATSIDAIVKLKDPIGDILDTKQPPNGLNISRVRVPLGVIGIIFESRPNVTADAGVLCLKSGNASILRCGSESAHSSRAIHGCLVKGLLEAGLPEKSIQLIPTQDRSAVGELLRLSDYVDIIVPRGGKGLIERVQYDSRVPVMAHLDGICHVYIDGAADMEKAINITVNAKLRRTGICGSAETLLIDDAVVESHMPAILDALYQGGCEIRGDKTVLSAFDKAIEASEEDWSTEYLDAIISVKIVSGVEGAIDHIAKYGSNHTDSIITENSENAEKFLNEVDSAIVIHNASTQYADGGEFGMGAEIGISTGKMHARGPVGLEQLTSYKYQVRGNGQARP